MNRPEPIGITLGRVTETQVKSSELPAGTMMACGLHITPQGHTALQQAPTLPGPVHGHSPKR